MILEDKLDTRVDRDFLHIMYSSGAVEASSASCACTRRRLPQSNDEYPITDVTLV